MNIYVLLTTSFCLFLYVVQAIVLGDWGYKFIVWNLFLALVPFLISTYIVRTTHRITLAILFCLWLIFLPNSFYILTDFVHIRAVRGLVFWMDLIVIFTFASTGILIGILSLYQIHELVRKVKGEVAGRIFAFMLLCFSGFGVYIGRFVRANSWDIFSDPLNLLNGIGHMLINPEALLLSSIFALLFNAAYFISISLPFGNNAESAKKT